MVNKQAKKLLPILRSDMGPNWGMCKECGKRSSGARGELVFKKFGWSHYVREVTQDIAGNTVVFTFCKKRF